ncbi:DNA-binding protein inhibitor ID-2-like [Astyanax mexicanus]|uniref:DNA-binding protein inhibitor ID-4 n=1 Tax=Astyanax mexicanus TaxID=7994 RepID=A0A8B9LXP9_ASTMX|nr:DNA-binding protein inhibitor ID-2-like [Astyanax mexicanus]
MKAISPMLPLRRSPSLSLERELGVWRSKGGGGAEEPLGLLCNMNDCYSRLKELVPSLPQNRSVSKMEILQHVIDYILDLQIALDSSSASPQQQQSAAPETAVISLRTVNHTSYSQSSSCLTEMTSDDHVTIPR